MKNIIVVTGASSGMGRDFAKLITKKEQVDEIWVIARREELLISLQTEIETKVVPIKIDLTDRNEIKEKYVKRLEEEKPNIKVLGCCAGFGRFEHYTNVSLETNLDMIEVNAISTVEMVNYSLPYMDNPSKIMIICSGSSLQPVPYQCMYGSTKAFTLSYSRALNRELKYRGIHVLGVVPLWVNTEFFSHAIDKSKAPVVINYGSIDEPEDVMKQAIKDLYKNKDVSYYGPHDKFQAFMVKLLPHKAVMNTWFKQQKLDGTPERRKEKTK